jgi:hypothetical protein
MEKVIMMTRNKTMKRRDKALNRVTRHTWQPEALRRLQNLCKGELLAEEIRMKLLSSGLPQPHHANAWGALIMAASKGKLITKTGEYKASSSARSHGRHQPIWRIV